jgi:hypothetical protein
VIPIVKAWFTSAKPIKVACQGSVRDQLPCDWLQLQAILAWPTVYCWGFYALGFFRTTPMFWALTSIEFGWKSTMWGNAKETGTQVGRFFFRIKLAAFGHLALRKYSKLNIRSNVASEPNTSTMIKLKLIWSRFFQMCCFEIAETHAYIHDLDCPR